MIKAFWQGFVNTHPEYKNASYEAWAFGVDPDELADLVNNGVKTATTSGYDLYAVDNEALPKVNDISIILDEKAEPVCIIKNHKVDIVPFDQVTADFAFKEGEGDRTLSYWRKVHIDFFEKEFADNGLTFKTTSAVVLEEFEKIY